MSIILFLFLLSSFQLIALSNQGNAEEWVHRHRGVESIQKIDEESATEIFPDYGVDETLTTTTASGTTETFTGPGNVQFGSGGNEQGKDVINCQCGFKRSGAGKIVGGTLADDHVWPWMAALVYVGNPTPSQFCGASLINTQYVLTAAHCVQDIASVGLDKFQVYLGTNLILTNATILRTGMLTIKSHPAFNKRTLNSDIALIKLATPVTFTDTIMPICLGQKGAPHIGRVSTVSGWGSLTASTNPVNALRNVNVRVVPNPHCEMEYAKVKVRITPMMLCAALPNKDSCKGDSGGPLFAKRSNSPMYDQIGVVSFGQDCAKPDFPGVYTRVGRFISWIRENTKDASYCAASFMKP